MFSAKRIAIGHIISIILICYCSIKIAEIVMSLNLAATEEELLFFRKI